MAKVRSSDSSASGSPAFGTDKGRAAFVKTPRDTADTAPDEIPPGGPRAILRDEPTFQFVVMADTHMYADDVAGQIGEINLLEPDFVIHLGDFVANTAQRWRRIEPMLEQFERPLFMVAGNHDIHDAESRRIYEGRFGRTYYSFDHKGVHFIALDSEIPVANGDSSYRIHGAQLEWLGHDLAAHDGARLKFVFVHQPFWLDYPPLEEMRALWMRDVHALLAKHRVSGVFAGHLHKFVESPAVDGVRYYVTFATGGKLFGPQEHLGNFHHCSVVTVRNDRWKLGVLRPASIEPATVVRHAHPSTVPVMLSLKAAPTAQAETSGRMPIEIAVRNPTTGTIEYAAEPILGACSQWRFSPPSRAGRVEAGATATIAFTAVPADGAEIYPGPRFRVAIAGLEERPVESELIVPFRTSRLCPCPCARTSPKIDGGLDDPAWGRRPPIGAFVTPTGEPAAGGPTEAFVTWDPDGLYVGIRCFDPDPSRLVLEIAEDGGETWRDDSVEVFLPRGHDDWHHFIWNADAVLAYDRNYQKGPPAGLRVARSGRQVNAWTLEAAFDWGEIDVEPAPGAALGFQIVRNRMVRGLYGGRRVLRSHHPGSVADPAGRLVLGNERTMWRPTFGINFRPEFFGTLRLEGVGK